MTASAQLPDNPSPQEKCAWVWSVPQGSVSGRAVGHKLCMPQYAVAGEPAPRRHNWIRRHPLATEMIVLGAAGALVLHWKWPHSCASKIDGVPYSGTPPCPKSCEGPGDCYWGGTTK